MQRDATILVVDDAPMGRELLSGLLEEDGFAVRTAESGEQALALARDMGGDMARGRIAAGAPDLVLLDVMMPGMDGFEVCRRMRKDPALAQVPVIMVTALDDRESRLKGIEAGADDFLTKPFDEAELCARARTITRLNRYRSLLEQRSRFEWVVEHSDDGYVLVDDQDRLRYANPKARLFLELPPEGDLPPEAGRLSDMTFLGQARLRYATRPAEAWHDWPPGPDLQSAQDVERLLVIPETETAKTLWLDVTWLRPASSGRDERLVRLRDVSEHKNAQTGMWTFHSMINHKLRTPLMGVVSGLEFLSQAMGDMGPEDVAEMLGIALDAALQLQDEITGVLEYQQSRGRAGQGERFRLASLPGLVGRIAGELGLDVPELAMDDAVSEARTTMAELGVECILFELFDNSRKFHPGGSPRMSVRATASGLGGVDGGMVRLAVSDDGLTLSPEQLARAWTPYDQMEKYHTGQALGLGLGLSTVAGLAWHCGGMVHIANNTPAPGITVSVTLPLAGD